MMKTMIQLHEVKKNKKSSKILKVLTLDGDKWHM